MWSGMEPMMGWGMGIGMISMVLFWALVILGIVVLVKWIGGGDRGSREANRALEILRERYARGEIDKAEFDARKRDLLE